MMHPACHVAPRAGRMMHAEAHRFLSLTPFFRRTWNSPVHNFCRMHCMPVFKAMRMPLQASYAIVFFFSALAHEVPIVVSNKANAAVCMYVYVHGSILP